MERTWECSHTFVLEWVSALWTSCGQFWGLAFEGKHSRRPLCCGERSSSIKSLIHLHSLGRPSHEAQGNRLCLLTVSSLPPSSALLLLLGLEEEEEGGLPLFFLGCCCSFSAGSSSSFWQERARFLPPSVIGRRRREERALMERVAGSRTHSTGSRPSDSLHTLKGTHQGSWSMRLVAAIRRLTSSPSGRRISGDAQIPSQRNALPSPGSPGLTLVEPQICMYWLWVFLSTAESMKGSMLCQEKDGRPSAAFLLEEGGGKAISNCPMAARQSLRGARAHSVMCQLHRCFLSEWREVMAKGQGRPMQRTRE